MEIVLPLASAIVGGLVVHLLATWRDRRNAQRAQLIEHLVSAYQRLVEASQRDTHLTPERVKNVEDAVSDVFLLGQRAEVDAASALIQNWKLHDSRDLKPLLIALRTSLRKELHLDGTNLPDEFNLRITPTPAPESSETGGTTRATSRCRCGSDPAYEASSDPRFALLRTTRKTGKRRAL